MKRIFKLTAFKLALVIGLVFAGTYVVWRVARPRVFPFPELELLEAKALDIKFQRRGAVASSGQVVIAGVDEAAIQRYGLWPWKREVVGRALKNLNDAGALAIGVDIFFPDEDRASPHQTVNRLLDEVAARASAEPPLSDALEAALAAANGPARAELERLKAVLDGNEQRLAAVREIAKSGRMNDPDEVFAGLLAQSPRVVLGISGLVDEDLLRVPEEIRRRDAELLERFTHRHLFNPELKVRVGDRVLRDWGPVESWPVAELVNVRIVSALQGPLPVLARATHHIGLIDSYQDDDGTIRRYPLFTRVGDRMVPSLALATAAVALDATPVAFAANRSVRRQSLGGVGLMRGEAGAPNALREEIPVDPWTGVFRINYPGSSRDEVGGVPLYDRISFADAVDNSFDPARVRGKVVLVGATAVGTFDQRVTPFDAFVPGVYTHAAVVDNILSRHWFEQTSGMAMVEAALMVVLALLFGLIIPRLRRIYVQVGFMVGAAFAFSAVDFVMFGRGVVVGSVMPLAEMVVLCFAMVLFNYVTVDREKRQVRTAFQYYLTKSVMEEMLRHPEKLKLGGDKRELTVLFSDIRGFTTISERLPPEELVRTLNEYLTPMTDLVFKHQGTLDKYMGDAIMAVWGAPLPQEDHAFRACVAAVEMLESLEVLRKQWREQGRPDIDIGIGINSGLMAVGNMGSDMRFDYTVMGDNVNLGSRLEGTNKSYGTRIIISEFTRALCKDRIIARELGSVRVKGKQKPVGIYELRGIGQATGEEAEAIAMFEEGIAAYRARDWDRAEACFRKATAHWGDDGPSEHYLEDIAEKRLHPPAEGWDGVYEMKTK